MILLFTDFGAGGPYLGQMKAVLSAAAPTVPVIDLMTDAPAHDPMSAAYLLAAYASEFPHGAVFLAVVDPGVGGERRAAVAEIDGRWFTGPDNGLFEPLLRRAGHARAWEIVWRPERLSASFHGRDLFAPVAARLAHGEHPWDEPMWQEHPWAAALPLEHLRRFEWPDELARIVYFDHFGNATIGMRASTLAGDERARGRGTAYHARPHLRRRAAGDGLLVRERQRPRRNRGQSGPRRSAARRPHRQPRRRRVGARRTAPSPLPSP